jgi:hypothetical protein
MSSDHQLDVESNLNHGDEEESGKRSDTSDAAALVRQAKDRARRRLRQSGSGVNGNFHAPRSPSSPESSWLGPHSKTKYDPPAQSSSEEEEEEEEEETDDLGGYVAPAAADLIKRDKTHLGAGKKKTALWTKIRKFKDPVAESTVDSSSHSSTTAAAPKDQFRDAVQKDINQKQELFTDAGQPRRRTGVIEENKKKKWAAPATTTGPWPVAHSILVHGGSSRFKRMKYPVMWLLVHLTVTAFLVVLLAYRYTQYLCDYDTVFVNAGKKHSHPLPMMMVHFPSRLRLLLLRTFFFPTDDTIYFVAQRAHPWA